MTVWMEHSHAYGAGLTGDMRRTHRGRGWPRHQRIDAGAIDAIIPCAATAPAVAPAPPGPPGPRPHARRQPTAACPSRLAQPLDLGAGAGAERALWGLDVIGCETSITLTFNAERGAHVCRDL